MGRRHRSTSSVSTLQIVFSIVALLAVCIVLAYLFAPRRPPAPAPSELSYAPPPKENRREAPPDAPSEPRFAERPAKTRNEPVATPQTVVPDVNSPYLISGTITDVRTGEPVWAAFVMATRQITEAERKDWQARNAAAVASRDTEGLRALRRESDKLSAEQSGRADLGGAYEVRVAMPGTYSIVVNAQDYVPVEAGQRELREDAPHVELDVALSTGAMVSGRVTETGTSIGVADLVIEVHPVRLDSKYAALGSADREATTDERGNYEATGLLPGEHSVTVRLKDTAYEASSEIPYKKIRVTTENQDLRGVDFSVDPAGVVWGYVMTPDREPIPAANVTLCTSDSLLSQALQAMVRQAPPLSSRSAEDGYYELLGVPLNEEWRLHADTGKHSPQLADPFMLTASHRSARLDVFLFNGSNVSGQVIDTHGAPVANAQVMCFPGYSKLVSPMNKAQTFRGDQADADGYFELNQVPAGQYQVMAQMRGYKIAAMGETIYPDGYSDIQGVTVVLEPVDEGDHAVFGTVTDTQGQPIDGANVALEGLGAESWSPTDRSASTDSGGAFRFDGVELGMYRLRVEKEGFSLAMVNRVLLDSPTRVVLEAAGVVRGRVLARKTNQPPKTYSVGAKPWAEAGTPGLDVARMVTASVEREYNAPDGSFEIYLAPGLYRVEAKSTGLTPAREVVTVEAGQVVDGVVLYLSEGGGLISGRVSTRDGKSPQGARLQLIEAGSTADNLLAGSLGMGEQQTQVGEDGFFSFENLPEGDYKVVAQHERYARAESELLNLREGGSETGVRIQLGAGGVLEGYVYQDGEALSGVVVMAMGAGTETGTTDAEGFYTIDGLSTGTYQVMATSLSGGITESLYGTRGARVDIQEGQRVRHDFGAGTGAVVIGQCTPPPRSFLGGMVVLREPGMQQVPLGGSLQIDQLSGQNAAVDPTGSFVIEDVPIGEWQLDVFYFEFGVGTTPMGARYVHTEIVPVESEEEVPLQLQILH